jgi:hypothetical protein
MDGLHIPMITMAGCGMRAYLVTTNFSLAVVTGS